MSDLIAAAVTRKVVEKCMADGNYVTAIRALHSYLYVDDENSKDFALGVFQRHAEDIAKELEKDDFLLAADAVRERLIG